MLGFLAMVTSSSRTGILIILDGFGLNPSEKDNAVALAKMPCYRRLLEQYPHTQIEASEKYVGLPQGFMGNSEVGHLNIGAGRVVYQDFSLISRAIETGEFFKNPALLQIMTTVDSEHTLHLMGLVSDGGVHSHLSHLKALISMAQKCGVKKLAVHCFLDGRDTSPHSGLGFIQEIETCLGSEKLGQIATVMGRFYAMDRDNRWERTERAFNAIVRGKAEFQFSEPSDYIEQAYKKGESDEFVEPACRDGYEGMKARDGVIFFNFRADRARQITQALTQEKFSEFKRDLPHLSGFVCMTPYDSKFALPAAFEKTKVPMTLGEVISLQEGKQLRIAETEKYAHVTYFFNGGQEQVFPGEKRVLIPSPREVKTYDLKPEMSAEKVTEALLTELNQTQYQFIVLNFANPDMVGHTGNLQAAVRALEIVDSCLEKIVRWVEDNKAFAVITADHGNCEKMRDAEGRTLTSHTTLPVPFLYVDPCQPQAKLAATGKLADIAPTFLKVWDIAAPPEMTGESLIL